METSKLCRMVMDDVVQRVSLPDLLGAQDGSALEVAWTRRLQELLLVDDINAFCQKTVQGEPEVAELARNRLAASEDGKVMQHWPEMENKKECLRSGAFFYGPDGALVQNLVGVDPNSSFPGSLSSSSSSSSSCSSTSLLHVPESVPPPIVTSGKKWKRKREVRNPVDDEWRRERKRLRGMQGVEQIDMSEELEQHILAESDVEAIVKGDNLHGMRFDPEANVISGWVEDIKSNDHDWKIELIGCFARFNGTELFFPHISCSMSFNGP